MQRPGNTISPRMASPAQGSGSTPQHMTSPHHMTAMSPGPGGQQPPHMSPGHMNQAPGVPPGAMVRAPQHMGPSMSHAGGMVMGNRFMRPGMSMAGHPGGGPMMRPPHPNQMMASQQMQQQR